ncbi:MAG: ABC transporter permease, partial [Nitrospinae bacterium]|nr:ABC transporter permease [Nitrospinota bacterium]
WLISRSFDSSLWSDISMTLTRVFIAFALSALIGVPLGMLMGFFPKVESAFRLPIDFSRSIPATALFPLFILLFGTGEEPRIAAAIYGGSLIILMNTMSGVKQANIARIKAAKAYGAKGWNLFYYVLIPEALPSIFTGFRLGVSLAFVIIILVEMFIGTSSGLGHRIIDAQILYRIPEVYASIGLTGIFGYLLNLMFAYMEGRIVHYSGR